MAWETKKKSGEGTHRTCSPTTSEAICEDVRSRLADDPGIDSSGIEVRVEGCRVILEGTVTSELAKQMAEVVAYEAEGVVGVDNALAVRARRKRETPPPPGRQERQQAAVEPGFGSYVETSISPRGGPMSGPFAPHNRPGLATGGFSADAAGSPFENGANLRTTGSKSRND